MTRASRNFTALKTFGWLAPNRSGSKLSKGPVKLFRGKIFKLQYVRSPNQKLSKIVLENVPFKCCNGVLWHPSWRYQSRYAPTAFWAARTKGSKIFETRLRAKRCVAELAIAQHVPLLLTKVLLVWFQFSPKTCDVYSSHEAVTLGPADWE